MTSENYHDLSLTSTISGPLTLTSRPIKNSDIYQKLADISSPPRDSCAHVCSRACAHTLPSQHYHQKTLRVDENRQQPTAAQSHTDTERFPPQFQNFETETHCRNPYATPCNPLQNAQRNPLQNAGLEKDRHDTRNRLAAGASNSEPAPRSKSTATPTATANSSSG